MRSPVNSGDRMRPVLVVDDDLDVIDSLRDVLELEGMTVATARSCDEVDRVLEAGLVPSVAIVDLGLGRGGSGHDVIGRIRGDASLRNVAVVAMSGAARDLAALAIADEYLLKPFDVERLLEVLDELRAKPTPG